MYYSSDEGCKSKAYNCCKDLLKPWIYKNNPGRYISLIVIRVAQSLVLCVFLFVDYCLSLCPFVLWTFYCLSYGFRFMITPLVQNIRCVFVHFHLTILFSVLWFTAFDYLFGIYKLVLVWHGQIITKTNIVEAKNCIEHVNGSNFISSKTNKR